MLSRRSLFSRLRDAAVALATPPIATGIFGRTTNAEEPQGTASSRHDFHTMPFDNPPFGAPPLTFGERFGVTVIVRTDIDLVRSLVPPPLQPAGSELMIQQNMNTITAPLQVKYPNATVIVPASLGQTDGFYMARVYEGSAHATMLTIWGREMYGFPKVAADTNVSRQGNQTSSYVRAGNAAADIVLQLQDTTRVEPEATLLLFCRKTIPSADNKGPDLDRIIEIPWRQTAEHRVSGEVEHCSVELDVRGKGVMLPIREYVDAFWFTQDAGTILDVGKVVHDYLA